MQDPQAVARFRREMLAVGRVTHPNIVDAMDAGEEDGRHFLVMEFATSRPAATIPSGRLVMSTCQPALTVLKSLTTLA